MSDKFNYLIDSIVAAFMRFFELPSFVLVIGIIIVFVLGKWILQKIRKKKIKWNNKIMLFLLFICSLLIIDKKMNRLGTEIDELTNKFQDMAMSGGAEKSNNYKLLVDDKEVQALFPESTVKSRQLNQAMQLTLFSENNIPAKAYITTIDLTYPTVGIHLSNNLKTKTLTSDFAKEYNCDVAINGEAGNSMSMNAVLDQWTGNYIIKGKPLLLTDTDKRPFLSFNEQNKATYFEESIVDTSNTPEKYNTIWGRFDILKKGEVVTSHLDRSYPRTIMGINKEGTMLYLMVVDGKRPNYSLGLSYMQCASILKGMGAYNVMGCDQGGSSCMYIKDINGIISRPADSEGIERPIYTHFGVSVK